MTLEKSSKMPKTNDENDENDMETKLLMAPKLKFRITTNKVVFAVEQL